MVELATQIEENVTPRLQLGWDCVVDNEVGSNRGSVRLSGRICNGLPVGPAPTTRA